MGECHHSYAFYGVARDNVGHVESAVATVQAQVYVPPNTLIRICLCSATSRWAIFGHATPEFP